MSDAIDADWFDASEPHDPELAQRQLDGLLQLLSPAPRRVVDLGCGDGRVLAPLAAAGHHVIGLDRNGVVLDRCAERLAEDAQVTLHRADFLEPWPELGGPVDAVCCLGNTLMTVADVDDAVTLLVTARSHLAPGGCFVMDDSAGELWPLLAEGDWQTGVSEDGTAQMVWSEDDAVFTLRTDGAVDLGEWQIIGSDRPLRLWTMGALRLLARCTGLSAPQRVADSGLLVMRAADVSRPDAFGQLS